MANNQAAGLTDAARRWRTRHPGAEVRLLTPRVLTEHRVALTLDSIQPTVHVDGSVLSGLHGAAALCLVDFYGPNDFTHFSTVDRAYVAAELTSSVAGVLSELECAVVNPIMGALLAGPGWTSMAWQTLAELCGLPSAPAPGPLTDLVVQIVDHVPVVTAGASHLLSPSTLRALERLLEYSGLRAASFRLSHDAAGRAGLVEATAGPRLDLCTSAPRRLRLLDAVYSLLGASRHPCSSP